jgi:hypothetical protein
MKMFRAFIIGCFCLVVGVSSLGIAAAEGGENPHDPNQNKGVPSLQRLALKAILEMEKRGGRVPPNSLPEVLERALERERILQQGAFRIVAYRPGFGAIGQFVRPQTINDHVYEFVYIHPNTGLFNSGMATGQTYVCGKLKPYKASVLGGFINAMDYRGPGTPTAENTVFALAGDILPQ